MAGTGLGREPVRGANQSPGVNTSAGSSGRVSVHGGGAPVVVAVPPQPRVNGQPITCVRIHACMKFAVLYARRVHVICTHACTHVCMYACMQVVCMLYACCMHDVRMKHAWRAHDACMMYASCTRVVVSVACMFYACCPHVECRHACLRTCARMTGACMHTCVCVCRASK